MRIWRAPYALVRKLAASFDIVGPLLGRFGRAEVPLPGGCVLGTRATDMHEQAFVALGCEVRNAHGYLIAESKHRRLQGNTIEFRMPSVGATKNAMLAAVLADGTTTIKNVSMEPEVTDLANFLVAMGAKISGLGSDTHRRSTASKNCTASSTRSFPIASSPERCCSPARHARRRDGHGLPPRTSRAPCSISCVECGVVTMTGDDWIRVKCDGVTGGTDILTAPYPGFPTDLQPQMVGFLCTAPGTSVVEESIFNARFSYVNELARMGADVNVSMESNNAVIKGVAQLSGAPVEAPDIRAGAGLVIAGLAAAGETEIIGLEYIDRGYERLEELLSALGGQVQRSSGVTPLVEPAAAFFETSEYPRISAAG